MKDEFETKREFWYFSGMVVSTGIALMLIVWGIITYAMCEDLTNRVLIQQEEITSYEEQLNAISYDASRYKTLYEEMYELHLNCVEEGGECVCQTKNEQS